MKDWQKLADGYFMNTGARAPVTLVKGRGALVWDDSGNEYLDFVCGWAVNNLGHCPETVVEAVKNQVTELIQASNNFYTIPQVELAQLLVNNSCFDSIFLCNSGAEANEAAVKLARRYGKLKLSGAYEVITVCGSFHGRTLSMVSASAQPKFQQPYIPLYPGYVNVAFNDIEAIQSATSEKSCAVMLEPIQGEGGVNVPSEGYLNQVRQWCDQCGILLILDEVQTGMGRCGSLFAYQQYGVEPDIISLAKGLGSGLPIGAIMAKKEASVFSPGDHGSTFGGNPVTCAAACASLRYMLEKDVPSHAAMVGNYFIDKLNQLKEKHAVINGVRGRGLLIAIGLDRPVSAELKNSCFKECLLVNNVQPDALRFMPPLIITKEEIDKALAILEKVFNQLS